MSPFLSKTNHIFWGGSTTNAEAPPIVHRTISTVSSTLTTVPRNFQLDGFSVDGGNLRIETDVFDQ